MNIRKKTYFVAFLFLLFALASKAGANNVSIHESDIKSIGADSAIVNVLRNNGITFSHDNDIHLLMSGQAKFDAMFEDIRNAKSSVHLEYFNFRNDSIANLLFDILAEKAAQGVEVRALFDAFGNSSNNQPLKKHHVDSIRSRGIELYEYDPIRFPWVNHIFGRDHRKIVVIDGKKAYTGGMNVADYYIKGTEQVGSWRDMHCHLTGSEVHTLQDIFLRIWNRTAKQNVGGDKYYQATHDGDMMAGIINREPHRTPKIIRTFYLNAINLAQDSIKLVNPYLTLNRKLKKAIKNAVKRGVKVEIMVGEKSDIPLTPDCVLYNVHKLMKAGCDIYIYQPGFHHTKIIMVDGKFCTVGSSNLDSRSLRCDFEENAVIIDKRITRQLSDMFDRDKGDSFILTEQKWKEFRTPWKRFVGWFAHLLSPFL